MAEGLAMRRPSDRVAPLGPAPACLVVTAWLIPLPKPVALPAVHAAAQEGRLLSY